MSLPSLRYWSQDKRFSYLEADDVRWDQIRRKGDMINLFKASYTQQPLKPSIYVLKSCPDETFVSIKS